MSQVSSAPARPPQLSETTAQSHWCFWGNGVFLDPTEILKAKALQKSLWARECTSLGCLEDLSCGPDGTGSTNGIWRRPKRGSVLRHGTGMSPCCGYT